MRGNPLVSRWDFSLDLSTLDAATGTIRRSPQFPFSSSFSRQSVSMSSLQQLLNARANLLLFSSNFLTPERIFFSSPATSYARAILLLYTSDFPTPERIFFSSPAISYARASDSSSLLQRFPNARANLLLYSSDFPTPERIFFSTPAISYARAILLLFSFYTSEISFVFTVLGGLDDAVTLLPLFFYATIS